MKEDYQSYNTNNEISEYFFFLHKIFLLSILLSSSVYTVACISIHSPLFELFHIFLCYKHKFRCILLQFYITDQPKIELGENVTWFLTLFPNKNQKSVECICIHPTLLWNL